MGNVTEQFLKDSNNLNTLPLTEAGAAFAPGVWTALDVDILDLRSGAVVLNITRAADGDGIALSAGGVLTINVAQLTEDVTVLVNNTLYRAMVKVVNPANPEGVFFGAPDSTDRLHMYVSQTP